MSEWRSPDRLPSDTPLQRSRAAFSTDRSRTGQREKIDIYKRFRTRSQQSEANMSCIDIRLNDLPAEILLKIFKNLNNMDVLYSLIGVEGLDLLVKDDIFTNTLNFVFPDNDKIEESMLNRFCNSILPQIESSVKCLVLKTTAMDRILRAGIYSNLTQLKILRFHASIFSHFCTGK